MIWHIFSHIFLCAPNKGFGLMKLEQHISGGNIAFGVDKNSSTKRFSPIEHICPATTAVPTWALREGQEARLVTKDCVHEI
jgi:hypothetical protein